MNRVRPVLLTLGLLLAAAANLAAQPVTLSVDASDAPRRIFRVRETIPVVPGPLTLAYPKWIPGEHGAEGPISDLAGLAMTAGGRPVAWKRSPREMWNFEIVVPPGAATLEVSFDYLASLSAYTTATARLACVNWWSVLLYPRGPRSNETMFQPTLTLPSGWKFGTALPVDRVNGDAVSFSPVSLVTLIDSPVLAGRYFRSIDLSPGDKVGHFLDIAGDSAASIEIGAEDIARYRRLVAEARALFGVRHYRSYHLLLCLSDLLPSTGLEHHESSDNRAAERALLDESARRNLGTLLAHEYVHSWNGKFRSPEGLVSGVSDDYQAPVDSELLWVYEGLTEYYGEVLGTRSGLRSPELEREALALFASRMSRQSGRAWRPLADTAVAAQLLYYGRPEWASWRRGVDFYPEGALVWLDADVLIRSRSGGRKSLDDFVRAFHGGAGGAPEVRTYAAEDVYAGLNAVLPWDWAGFFRERVYDVAPRAPIGGIENAGWKLASTDVPPALVAAAEEETEAYDFWDSLGIVVQGDGKDGPGLIADVVPGMAAAQAGVGPGMKLVAVDGRRYTNDRLRDALRLARGGTEPIELLVENADTFRVCKVDDHGGERYPVLVRDPSRPDLLSAIGKPLVPVSSKQ
jgi:predicted metalloprotease with PDZ domain